MQKRNIHIQSKSQPRLQSKRLTLRPYTLADAAEVQVLAGDNRIAKQTMSIRHPYEDGMAEKWISSLDEKWQKRERVEFAIILKENSTYIGSMSFVSVEGVEAEIGYWIGYPYWNNGYCTEAGKLLVKFGLTKMCLNKITARHLATNPASGKILENLGLIWSKSEYQKDRYGKSVKFEFFETP